MSDRKEYKVEIAVRSSPGILYNFLSTPSGLAQWFADSVDINEKIYSFFWNGAEEKAELVESEEDVSIKYRWDWMEEEEYFEFVIGKSEITGDTILFITDFADEFDMEDNKMLWESQIDTLKKSLGAG